jgi:hypothetical protein
VKTHTTPANRHVRAVVTFSDPEADSKDDPPSSSPPAGLPHRVIRI